MHSASPFMPLIVGNGRMAKHFRRYLTLKRIPHLAWNRKRHSLADLDKKLAQASRVLLLIKDSAIGDFRDRHLKNFKKPVIAFSGALAVRGVESFHPLMTFGPKLYPLSFYEKIHFAAPSKAAFRRAFPALRNPVFKLKAADKAFYHALCVMSGNFPHILWAECLDAFQKLGVPAEALGIYLQKNLDNFRAAPGKSLTGPLARNDKPTMRKNIAALPARLKPLYKAFVRFYLSR